MAFNRTPMQDTYQVKPISFLYQWDDRSSSVDGKGTLLKNVLAEPVGKEYFEMMKRDGTETLALSPAPDGPILGIYYWQPVGVSASLVVIYLSAVGVQILRMYDPSTFVGSGPLPLSGTNTGDAAIYFQEFLYQNGTTDLMFTTTAGLFRLTSAGVVTGPIAGAPGGSLAYLDGYLVATNGTSILNSNLNNPLVWSASDFLAADSYADLVLRVARVGPYIVALGSDSVQYFYDAGNPTGTPFAANTGATKRIGYLGGYATIGDDVLFVGAASGSAPAIYRVSGLKINPEASFPFSRFWNDQGNMYSGAVAPDGAILNLNGHTCYYFRTPSTPFPVGPTPPNPLIGESYFYDLDSSMFTKLGYQTLDYYLIKYATTYSSTAGVDRMTYINVLGSAVLHRFNKSIYRDDGVNFEVKFRTRPMDFDTRRMKFGSRMVLACDQTPTSSLAFISWSDNDYITTSTPRSIDLSYQYKQLFALGAFRARSFTLTYSDNFPMRWQSIELDYNQGSA